MAYFYPNIRPETMMSLQVVAKNLAQDPEYLNDPACPYSEEIKDFFRAKIERVGGSVEDLFAGDDENLVLDTQIIKVINDLESFGSKLTSNEATEKMAYFRTKTALIEKLVNMRERLSNLKEIADFRNAILSFMDEVCSKDQITDLMRRLDGILGLKQDDIL